MNDYTVSTRKSNELWLTSLTDLMMLLVVFFVIQIAPEAILSIEDERQKLILDETLTELKNFLEKEKINNKVDIHHIGNKADISFDNSLIFDVGTAILDEEQHATINSIVKNLVRLKDTHEVRIEGHTDNVPILTKKYKSNWELSSDRSLQVLRIFIDNGYNQSMLSAQGFGEFRPLVPNTDENGKDIPENQAKNRRVTIHIKGTEEIIIEHKF